MAFPTTVISKPGRRLWTAICLVAALTLLLGCVSEPKAKRSAAVPSGRAGIQEINLLAMPVAVNLGQVPGPDGFVLKIYASNPKAPKPLPIENGKVDVFMYDGVPSPGYGAGLQPRKMWSFTSEELKRFEIHSSIGTGYQLALEWGDAKPARYQISVVVRYTAANGFAITSAPSVISVALK